MDASMYELCSSTPPVDDRRRHMTLDLAASQRKCFYPASTGDCTAASPDLEAFLLYAGEQDSTADTPTQILFPKSVTAEQEAYARGFVDALEELHRRQGVPAQSAGVWTTHESSTGQVGGGRCWSASTPGQWSSGSSPASSVGAGRPRRRDDAGTAVPAAARRPAAQDEGAQTVPRLAACLTPPSSPDVAVVEAARADRKRERNRLAAQKCRSRKLEQITVLESRCAVLRAHNDALSRYSSHAMQFFITLTVSVTGQSSTPPFRIQGGPKSGATDS